MINTLITVAITFVLSPQDLGTRLCGEHSEPNKSCIYIYIYICICVYATKQPEQLTRMLFYELFFEHWP